jgi:putative 4-mercaptohistidine N1-methyltranferase
MAEDYYDSDRGLAEYLLFHYGAVTPTVPPGLPKAELLDFPARCVSQCLDTARLPAKARALDLGCAVGRSSFELARHCAEVIGIDFSERFIETANQLRQRGFLRYQSCEEGELTCARMAVVPRDIDRRRVKFEVGDATHLRKDLGKFDVVLAANLIDRLREPLKFSKRLPDLLNPEGHLIIASPYTWLTSYTPRKNWLGGVIRGGKPVRTHDVLRKLLWPNFRLLDRLDLPFLLREHARKYQLGISEATVWLRRKA